MNKIEYFISGVRFEHKNNRHHIEYLKVHKNENNSLGESSALSKDNIVSAIEAGISFSTIYQTSYNSWTIGDEVKVVRRDYQAYLRTDGNNVEADDLGKLPTF